MWQHLGKGLLSVCTVSTSPVLRCTLCETPEARGDELEEDDTVGGAIFKAHGVELSNACHLNVADCCRVCGVLGNQNSPPYDF